MKTMLPLITVAVVALSLSCGGSADFPPTQTPLQWPDSKLVELTTDFRPTEFVGDGTAGIGRNGEVYLLNLSSREHRQVTNDRHPKIEAVISGDYVAWTDERRKIRLPGRNGTGRQYSTDIFLRNLTTGEERRITDVPAKRKGLRFSGSRLVWQDNRNELHERYSDFDVFAYDLKTGREIPIAVAPGAQIGPAIFKETVVWADNRNSPTMGSPKAGCDRCPHNTFDIYAYDFTTGEKTLLAHTGSYRGRPDIYGRHVVWHGFGEGPGTVHQAVGPEHRTGTHSCRSRERRGVPEGFGRFRGVDCRGALRRWFRPAHTNPDRRLRVQSEDGRGTADLQL